MRKSAAREPRDGLLSAPGDLYDTYAYSRPAVVVRREALNYAPTSTSRPNHDRLPDLGAMADMELAYREQSYSNSAMSHSARAIVGGIFLVTLVAASGFVLVGQFLSISECVSWAGALLLLDAAYGLYNRTFTIRRLLVGTVLVPAGFLLAKACSVLLLDRFFGTLVCGTTTMVVFWVFGGRPYSFYYQWLFAHPRLKPSTRRTCPRAPTPDLVFLALLLTVVLVLPAFSTGAALLTLIALCIVKTLRFGTLSDRVSTVPDALTQWLTYGVNSSHAPGLWRPAHGAAHRWLWTVFMLAPFYLTLAVGLTMFYLDRETFTLEEPFGDWPRWAVVSRSPVEWMTQASEKIAGGEYGYLWCFVLALLGACLLPPFMLIAVYARPWFESIELRRRVDGYVAPSGRAVAGLDDDGRPEWQWYVDRLENSPHVAHEPVGDAVREAEHLFVGVEPFARFPILLDRKLLAEHAYFVGDSGSGKTSQGLMPLLLQLIRGHRTPSGERSPCPPIIVLDLKGDLALFHTVKREAEDRGARFRFFNPERGRASHYFDPFENMASKNRTDIQLANLLLDALSLNHGEGYGRGYYSRQSRQLLFEAITHADKPRTFDALYRTLIKLRGEGDAHRDTYELLSTIHALQSYPMLSATNAPPSPEHVIHMPTALEDRQVVYFWLPAAVESISVREIAKLALYSLLTAAIDRNRDQPASGRRQAYVVIDEFQRIAGANFLVILEQARSFNLSVILANQTVADLRTPDVDLRPTIRTNTRVKRYFSVTDPDEVRALSDSSGEELMFVRSWTQFAGQSPYTEFVAQGYNARSDTQSLKNRLTVNDILAVSDHPLDSILHVSRGSGYTQFAGLPLAVRSTWPIPKSLYQHRQDSPWPAAAEFKDNEVIVSDKSPLDIEYDREREQAQKIHDELQQLLAGHA